MNDKQKQSEIKHSFTYLYFKSLVFLFSPFPLAGWCTNQVIPITVVTLNFKCWFSESQAKQKWENTGLILRQWEDDVEPFKLQLFMHTQWFNHNNTRKIVMKPDIKYSIKQIVFSDTVMSEMSCKLKG